MESKEKTAVKAAETETTEKKEQETKTENTPAPEKKEVKKSDEKKRTAEEKEEEALDAEEGEEEEEVNTDELFKRRESINLTPENATFSPSVGGLISLKVINAEGVEETFERVVIRRSFPISSPNEFLSVREPDTRAKGRGAEIGMIRSLDIFDKATVDLINAELAVRYFTPIIQRITSAKEKFGYNYWEAETTAGKISFVLTNPFYNIRVLEDGRVYIFDIDGNCFLIPDPTKLDRQSFKYIEIYL